MKAVVIRGHGGPEQVAVIDLPAPTPGPGEAVVAVRAAALNHLDIWVRKGRPGMALSMPHTLGSDAAGVVVAVGTGVTRVKEGDEVVLNPGLAPEDSEFVRRGQQSEDPAFSIVGLGRPGTFAEQVAVPARNLFPKPPHLTFEQAAALPLAHVTAWRMLIARARLLPGETVLIHGIGGGVALAGLQIAKLAGAWTVVTSSSADKLERARQLGADAAINYLDTPDIAAEVVRLTSGRGVDVAFDAVGAATWPVNLAAVRKGGRIVHCGITTGADVSANIQAIYWKQLSVLGSTMGSDEDFRLMLSATSISRLVPVVDAIYSLDEAPAAMARMEAGAQFGKLVLTP